MNGMPIKTLSQFIIDARFVHENLYKYSKVEYVSGRAKVIIGCKIHGDFLQSPDDHVSGHGCPSCGREKCIINRNCASKFFIKAKKKHGDYYGYSKVLYRNAKEKIVIICPKHGEFEQTPDKHLQGGCKMCGMLKSASSRKGSTVEYIDSVKKIHGDRYDYSKVVYTKAIEKVIIICREHGEFQQVAISHSRGVGCAKCANVLPLTTEEFVSKAIKVHGDLYDYSNAIYLKSNQKLTIICKEHGAFLQTPNKHLGGRKCNKCSPRKYSNTQILWLDFISSYYGIHIQHACNDGEFNIGDTLLKADGYCRETNTIFEYHGDFWHGNPKMYNPDLVNPFTKSKMIDLYNQTKAREQKIKQLGYHLVVMWESDWKGVLNAVKKMQRRFRSRRAA